MRGRSDNRHSEELAKRREIICGSTFEPEPRAAKPWWPALEMNARLPFLEMVIIWSLCHHLRTCGPFSIHHPWSQKLQIMYFAIKKSLKGTRYVFLSPAVIIRSLALISVRDTIRTENYVHFFDSWPICRFYNFQNECREFAKITVVIR